MANRIDKDNFIDERSLPVKDESEIAQLDRFIEAKQNNFFKEVFGYEFQKTMLADVSNPIYSKILEPSEFTDSNGDLQEWEGINESLINYVYFYYNKELVLKRTSVGFSAGNTENGYMTNNVKQPVMIWNRLIESMKTLHDLLYVNADDYPTLIFTPYTALNEFNI